jgi:hypothetical protein
MKMVSNIDLKGQYQENINTPPDTDAVVSVGELKTVPVEEVKRLDGARHSSEVLQTAIRC